MSSIFIRKSKVLMAGIVGHTCNLWLVKIYTSIVKPILRSPLHGLVSKNTMLITFSGRKSGKVYTTPVGYVRNDNDITVFSQRHSSWWRNLRGGASVTVRLPRAYWLTCKSVPTTLGFFRSLSILMVSPTLKKSLGLPKTES